MVGTRKPTHKKRKKKLLLDEGDSEESETDPENHSPDELNSGMESLFSESEDEVLPALRKADKNLSNVTVLNKKTSNKNIKSLTSSNPGHKITDDSKNLFKGFTNPASGKVKKPEVRPGSGPLPTQPKIPDYVRFVYTSSTDSTIKLTAGIVEVYSEEFDDFTINFLHHSGLHGSTTYHFPPIKDSCPVPGHYMLKVMSYPTLRAGSRVNYTFTKEECDYCIQRAEIILSQE